MKILFYLPVVTPWWFENYVEPLIRRVRAVGEVHVLAPERWRNTGLGPDELQRCADLSDVTWSIVGKDHESLRTRPADPAGLIGHVEALAPDLVLCRSMDFETARRFPGIVRFMMEVAVSPFVMARPPISFTASPFVNGAMPRLSASENHRLDSLMTPLWDAMYAARRSAVPSRADLFQRAGIPQDRPVLLLPLEYEHEENFAVQHRVVPGDNRALLTAVAQRVTPHATLVVTNHPLNIEYVGDMGLAETVEGLGPQVILAESEIMQIPSSIALAPFLDGMLLNDSKTFSLAAAFGVPMCRQSRFASADWLRTETDLDRFIAAVGTGTAQGPAQADARLWFGHHLLNEAFDPMADDLDGDDVLSRAVTEIDPARWEAAAARILPAAPDPVE